MPADIAHWMCDGLVLAAILYAIAENPHRIKLWAVAVIVFAGASFAWTHVQHPEYDEDMFVASDIFGEIFSLRRGLALLFILSLESDPRNILRTLQPCALIVWLAYTIRSLLGIGLSELGSNHDYGYAFLMVSIVFSLEFIKKKNVWHFLGMVIPLVQVILYASRTAILSYGLFWVLRVVFSRTRSQHHGRKAIISIALLALGFLLTSSFFVGIVRDVTESLGVSSKIIESYVQGNFEMDEGRAMMYENNRSLLLEHPAGLGVYWDRYLYTRFHYTHNVVYEMLLDYGWFLGGAILAGIVLGGFSLMAKGDDAWKDLFMLFFCLCAVRLCLSHSFWVNKDFWGMIAVLLAYHFRASPKNGSPIVEPIRSGENGP